MDDAHTVPKRSYICLVCDLRESSILIEVLRAARRTIVLTKRGKTAPRSARSTALAASALAVVDS